MSFSFSIGAGRFYEDGQVLGLSHLLEHCIFAPNKAYPKIGQLTEFIDSNGGDINAWTDELSTNFHVSCPVNIALEAIEMLANKLFYPVFDKATIKSEIIAIDAEFSSKKGDETRRLASVQKSFCNQTHPYHRFSIGSEDTLTAVSLEQLIEQLYSYHQCQFVANNMSLAMSFPASDDTDATKSHQKLFNDAGKILERLPSNEGVSRPTTGRAFSPLKSHQLISIKSNANAVVFSLFIDKCDTEELDNLALTMLDATLTSRHMGGLVDVIRREFCLIDFTLRNGFDDHNQSEIQFCLSFGEHLDMDAVVHLHAVFSDYIDFVIETKIPRWRFREKQKQCDLQLKFAKQKPVLERTIELAEHIRTSDVQDDEHEAQISVALDSDECQTRLQQILKHIREQNLSVYKLSDHGVFDLKTEYFDVEYRVEKIPVDPNNARERFRFNHAPRNTFLPSSIEVFQPKTSCANSPSETPHHYHWAEQSLRLDYWLCYKDHQPLGDIYVSFISKGLYGSDRLAVAKRIWLECVQAHLKAHFFQAEDAGLYFKVYGHNRGISIQTSGFTDRQILLVYELLNQVTSFQVSEAEFSQGKSKVERKLSRSLWQKPINKLFSVLSETVHSSVIKSENLLGTLDSLEYTDYQRLQDGFFEALSIESLMVGNWPLALANRLKEHLYDRFSSKFVVDHSDIPIHETRADTANERAFSNKLIDISHSNEQAFMLFQSFGEIDKSEQQLTPIALALLIEAFLSPLVFVEMRNVRNVGYNLGVGYKPIELHAGIVVYAQSPALDQDILKEQMLDGLHSVISKTKSAGIDFSSLKALVCQQINTPVENASSLGRYIWQHYDNPEPLDYAKKLQAAVNAIDESEFWLNCEQLLENNDSQMMLQTKIGGFRCHLQNTGT